MGRKYENRKYGNREYETSEYDRIRFLINRDGCKATRDWVERTLHIYQEALKHPGDHHATLPQYRMRFEKSIHEFENWLNKPDCSI